jgi:GNAT superfamily N-acetyltransferase
MARFQESTFWAIKANRINSMNKDQTLTLPSGIEIPFRVARPGDAPALQRLHARCSERTIYLRFLGPMKKLSDEQARYFASTDGVDHFGLVALDPQDPNEIIAVVRYARKPGDERAEYAALVEDSWQGQGVGAALTHQLIDEARGNGVGSFYALVKGGNKRMLSVLRHLDLPERERVEDGERMVEIGLSSEDPQTRARSASCSGGRPTSSTGYADAAGAASQSRRTHLPRTRVEDVQRG